MRNSLQTVDLLKSGRIDVRPLISHRLLLADFERDVNLIKNKQEQVKKVLIVPNG